MVMSVVMVVRVTLGAPLPARAMVVRIGVQVGGVHASGRVVSVSVVFAVITRWRRVGMVVGWGKV
jgi:hypothetical protein